MEYIIAALAGFLCFFLVYVAFNFMGDITDDVTEMEEKDEEVEHVFLKLLVPFGRIIVSFINPFFREVDQTIFFKEKRDFQATEYFFRFTGWWRNSIAKLLIGSGQMDLFDPMEVIGLQFVGLMIGTGVGVFFYSETSIAILLVLCPLAGFFLALISLSDQAKNRRFETQIMLPYALDLLTLSVEAGIDFTAALQRIVDKGTTNPLLQEFSRMIQQIQVGKPRASALRELSDRIDLEEVKSLTQALIQADELGSPLGPVLRIQSEQLRTKRAQRAEKLAQQAPVKMLFPLVGCIFPTVFIVLFGPMAIGVYLQFKK